MYVDLHSHLLPNVDDGAQTYDDSVALALNAIHEGVTHVVLTPHHQNGRYVNAAKDVIENTNKLRQVYENNGVNLQIFSSQEIRLTDKFIEDYYSNQLLSLDGHGKYFLIEFPTRSIPVNTFKIIQEIVEIGLTPVIAHPERNEPIMKDYLILYDLITMGCIGQLTTGSVSGLFGQTFQDVSRELISLNLIHIISSDAHNIEWRPFNYEKANQFIIREFGQEKMDEFQENSRSVFNGTPINTINPIKPKANRFKNYFKLLNRKNK